MNIQDLKSKFKNIFDICVDFVLKNKRYFLAGVIFIVMVLVVFLGTSPHSSSGKNTSGVYESFKENKDTELDTLINSYYTDYIAGDTDALQTIATPFCDREISFIQFYSQYIESYSDLSIYTKPGLTDGSYLVTTKVTFKYVDVDTAAPGLDFFYVETNDEGKLYINNIYKSFNQDNNVYEMDSEISDLYAVYIRQQDLLDMRAEVEEKYEEAIATDDSLNLLMAETLPAAIQQWNVEYDAQVAAEEEAKAQEEAEAAAAAEAEAQAAAEAEEEANAFTGTTNAKANVRESADSESTKLGSLESGVTITIYAEEGDFYKFDYNGTKAYITKSAVTVGDATEDTDDDSADDEETTTTAASIAEGTEVTLTSTTNIRSQMDKSSSKVAVAYAGEKVTVVMSYAEGWTKVKYGNKEGYILTELLQE